MITEKRAMEITNQMFDELYRNSTPRITWKAYKKRYGGKKIKGYERHYLPAKKSEDILDKYKRKVGRFWRNSLSMLWLDHAPTSYKKKRKR